VRLPAVGTERQRRSGHPHARGAITRDDSRTASQPKEELRQWRQSRPRTVLKFPLLRNRGSAALVITAEARQISSHTVMRPLIRIHALPLLLSVNTLLSCDMGQNSRAHTTLSTSQDFASQEKRQEASPKSRPRLASAQRSSPPTSVSKPIPPLAVANTRTEDENNTIAVFREAAPATVFVTQKKLVRRRWSMDATEVPAGTGTGFIWNRQGHIVTNFHVVAGGQTFEVMLQDGSSHPARFVGGDPTKDIAVLKLEVPPTSLSPIKIPPHGSELLVGQKALAIGNPFGLDHTLTTGVISALGREIVGFGGVTIRDMIQTDASINPGNSGGPLLNSAGTLIGMNTMIYSPSGSSAGIGLAVPVSIIRRVVPQIITYGKPRRAGLGIDRVPDALAHRNGIEGVVIRSVVPRGPAHAAGLRGLRRTRRGSRVGDVIVGINGKAVRDFDDLFGELDRQQPGDEVMLRIRRGDSIREIRVRLSEL